MLARDEEKVAGMRAKGRIYSICKLTLVSLYLVFLDIKPQQSQTPCPLVDLLGKVWLKSPVLLDTPWPKQRCTFLFQGCIQLLDPPAHHLLQLPHFFHPIFFAASEERTLHMPFWKYISALGFRLLGWFGLVWFVLSSRCLWAFL